jgi:hypothetical protein
VAKKRAIGRYPKAFWKMAVERLKRCDAIVALSHGLGVHRRLLYKWRDQLEPIEDGEGPAANSRERILGMRKCSMTGSAGCRIFIITGWCDELPYTLSIAEGHARLPSQSRSDCLA